MVVEELLSFMPIGSFLALLSVELYSTLNNICSWWNGGKRELRIVSVTSLLTQKAICSLYFSGSLHNNSVHGGFGVSRLLTSWLGPGTWWNGGKRELRIVSVTSLLTQKAICSLYFSGSTHNTSEHQEFGVSRQLVIILWVSWGCSTNQRYQITVRLLDKCVEPRRHSLNAPFNLVDTTGNYSSP